MYLTLIECEFSLILCGISGSETRGSRTPDNLIKSQVSNAVFTRFIGIFCPENVTKYFRRYDTIELHGDISPYLQ